MPEPLSGKLALTGVEMDATTARIARLLYPNARIRHEDFTKARLPELYDLAIGNPPFSDRTVRADDPAGGAAPVPARLFHRALDRAAEAGRPRRLRHLALDDGQDRPEKRASTSPPWPIWSARSGCPKAQCATRAAPTSSSTSCSSRGGMREQRPPARRGTTLAEAVPAEDGEAALSINRYFVEHPEMVLGTHARTTSAYGPAYTWPAARRRRCAREPLDRGPRSPAARPLQPRAAHPEAVAASTRPRSAPPPTARRSRKAAIRPSRARSCRSSTASRKPVAVRDGKGTRRHPGQARPHHPRPHLRSATPCARSCARRERPALGRRRRSGCASPTRSSSATSGRST